MITPAERILAAVDENYMTLPNRTHQMASGAITQALEDLLVSVGWCHVCWGRGYVLEFADAGTTPGSDALVVALPEDARARPCGNCGRGKALENIARDNLFSYNPE